LQLAYDRDNLSPNKSQNQLEQDALLAVVRALPISVRPVILADRGFHRASFLAWWERHDLVDYVVRLKKGTCISEADGGGRWKLGEEELKPGELYASSKVCATASTTEAHGSYGSTWPCVGRCQRVEREIPGASSPESPGTWRGA
jgi:hypothetical protein